MPLTTKRLNAALIVAGLAAAVAVQAQSPVPPVKPGLWETKISQLDATGKQVPSPEFAGIAKMSPEIRAQMAAAMKARGVQMPDENGVMKACLTSELLNSGEWQQMAKDAGCNTTYSSRTNSLWKWHTSCTAALKSESDGETTYTGNGAYRSKVTSTSTVMGKTSTDTRIVEGKWLGADCGDIKPLPGPPARGGR